MIHISELELGDIVQNMGSGNSYQVTRIIGDNSVFAIREIEISNPDEWRLIKKQALTFLGYKVFVSSIVPPGEIWLSNENGSSSGDLK